MAERDRPGSTGWRDILVLERELLSIVVPIFVAMVAAFLTFAMSLYLLLLFAPLAMLPFVALGVAVWAFARWERWRFRPPWERANEDKVRAQSPDDLYRDVFRR